jgi:putative RecB family exonuclease
MTSQTLPNPRRLSPSSVAKYEQCPLAYRFSAIDRLPWKSSEPAVLGTFVHSVLEAFLSDSGSHDVDKLRAAATTVFTKLPGDRDWKNLALTVEQQSAFKHRAWELLENYLKIEDPDTVHAESHEMWVEAVIDGDIPVGGRIDRLDLNDDKRAVIDYKTGKVPNPRFVDGEFKAMRIYAALLDAQNLRPDELRLEFLAGPICHTAPVDQQVIDDTIARVRGVWDAVRADCESGEFDPTPNALCDWCDAKPYCPAKGGDFNAGLEIAATNRRR